MRGSVLGSCHRLAPARRGTYLLRQPRGCEWQACRTSLPRTFCLVVTVIAQPHRSCSGGKTQTRQRGDASGDVKRKLKVFSPITDPRATQETTKTRTVFTFFAFFFFAFLPNDFELNSSFWQSWPWYYTLKPDYAKATPTLQQRPCYYTC